MDKEMVMRRRLLVLFGLLLMALVIPPAMEAQIWHGLTYYNYDTACFNCRVSSCADMVQEPVTATASCGWHYRVTCKGTFTIPGEAPRVYTEVRCQPWYPAPWECDDYCPKLLKDHCRHRTDDPVWKGWNITFPGQPGAHPNCRYYPPPPPACPGDGGGPGEPDIQCP